MKCGIRTGCVLLVLDFHLRKLKSHSKCSFIYFFFLSLSLLFLAFVVTNIG